MEELKSVNQFSVHAAASKQFAYSHEYFISETWKSFQISL